MELIDNGISSVNAIVGVLLNREEYRELFVDLVKECAIDWWLKGSQSL